VSENLNDWKIDGKSNRIETKKPIEVDQPWFPNLGFWNDLQSNGSQMLLETLWKHIHMININHLHTESPWENTPSRFLHTWEVQRLTFSRSFNICTGMPSSLGKIRWKLVKGPTGDSQHYVYIYALGTQSRKKRRVSGKTWGFWQKPKVFQTNTKIRG
jgi:hypothetical protein